MTSSLITRKANLRGNLILAAVPALGFLFGAPKVSPNDLFQCLLFAVTFYLLFAAVRLLEVGAFPTPENGDAPPASAIPLLLLFLGASFLLTLLFFKTLFLYWLIVLGLAAAYYSGFTRFQYVPILSTITFFAVHLFAFAAGYGAVQGINLNGFIFGIYFALVFAAGQLVGEVAAIEDNPSLAKGSNADTFGSGRVLRFSFGVFGFAFVYLVVLCVARSNLFIHLAPFLIAFFAQSVLYLKLQGKADGQRAQIYQYGYRVIYSLAAAGYLVIRLVMTVS